MQLAGSLFPDRGSNPQPASSAVKAWSPNHGAAREFPRPVVLKQRWFLSRACFMLSGDTFGYHSWGVSPAFNGPGIKHPC